MNYKKRIEALKARLQGEMLDGLIVTKRENILYLTGFEGYDSALIITVKDGDFVISDPRFKEYLDKELAGFKIRMTDGPRHSAIALIAKRHKIKRLGFESDHLSYNNVAALKERVQSGSLIPMRYVVEDLRLAKDADEIRLIKKSVSILKKAFSFARDSINPRQTGQGLAVAIDNFMRTHGAERPAFQAIVAQSPYSSHPHAAQTARAFGKDGVVLIDIGAVFNGYNSDLTRVLFLGRITAKFKRIYNIIKTAQGKVIDKVRPGVKISTLDKTARNYIGSKGVGKYFLHSLGHGIGLEIHEPPKISKKNRGALRPGMIFTVEPGIYIPGWGGIRLEDLLVVTEDGCEVLSDDIPK